MPRVTPKTLKVIDVVENETSEQSEEIKTDAQQLTTIEEEIHNREENTEQPTERLPNGKS